MSGGRLFHQRLQTRLAAVRENRLKAGAYETHAELVPTTKCGCVHVFTVLWVVDWKLRADMQAGSTQERGRTKLLNTWIESRNTPVLA